MKKTIKILAAILVAVLLLWLLQRLVMPKYMGQSQEGRLIGEYYANAGDNDVIFVGDREVYENFSPVTLWEEYGITSYIRGSPQQTIWQSYYLMEETLQYETPKVFVFNVLSMKYDTPQSTGDPAQREAYNRMTLDSMRWSSAKWNAIQASMTQEERQWESMVTYILPILRYHSRWSQLTWEDVRYLFGTPELSSNGYLMQTEIRPYTTPYMEPPLVDYSFGENSWYYLEKMVQLCQDKGIELVLIKAPSQSPVWWDAWDAQIEAFAQENGLKYINMLQHQEEIGIDWATDTYDAGLHLNAWGAEKATCWFGQILAQECGLTDRRSDEALSALWAKKAQAYYSKKPETQDTQGGT